MGGQQSRTPALFSKLGDATIGVIGMPGAGKSTFLNGLVELSDKKNQKEVAFETGVGRGGCTTKVADQVLTFNKGKDKLRVVDTMGWPHTDKSEAAQFYDTVVNQCINRPGGLNAIIWIVKQDRMNHEVYEQYKAFMTELTQAACPIYLLVNGTENYKPDKYTKEELQSLKAKHRAELLETGKEIVSYLDLQRLIEVCPSADQTEFETETPKWLSMQLSESISKVSHVRTYADMRSAWANAESALRSQEVNMRDTMARLSEELQEEVQKREKRKVAMDKAKVAAAAAVTTAAISGWFTFGAGWVIGGSIAAGVSATAVVAAARLPALSDDQLAEMQRNLRAEQDRLKQGLIDLREEAERSREHFQKLKQYLEG